MYCLFFFFFFQAEDGIRDLYVTGVQTCALPILVARRDQLDRAVELFCRQRDEAGARRQLRLRTERAADEVADGVYLEIGRASCRERVEISVGAGSLKKKRKRRVE